MSFKVEVRGRGETTWASNALRFRTRKEADAYGSDLYSRWMGAEAVRTATSRDPVTYVWTGRTAERLTGKVHHLGGLNIPEIDGSSRRRPAHPRGRGERKGIEIRLTRRSGRRRYRGR